MDRDLFKEKPMEHISKCYWCDSILVLTNSDIYQSKGFCDQDCYSEGKSIESKKDHSGENYWDNPTL